MRLTGKFRGLKSATFKPEGETEAIPYAFARVRDVDSGDNVKVKPASSDTDDLADFVEAMSNHAKEDQVSFVVEVDGYGNLRYAGDAADAD